MKSLDILAPLLAKGITLEQIMQEIIWLNWKGIDLCSVKGTADYATLSRTGRDFAMARRDRIKIAEYVNRVAEVTVTNVECYHLAKEAG